MGNQVALPTLIDGLWLLIRDNSHQIWWTTLCAVPRVTTSTMTGPRIAHVFVHGITVSACGIALCHWVHMFSILHQYESGHCRSTTNPFTHLSRLTTHTGLFVTLGVRTLGSMQRRLQLASNERELGTFLCLGWQVNTLSSAPVVQEYVVLSWTFAIHISLSTDLY